MTAKSPKNTSAPKDNKPKALLFAAKVIKKQQTIQERIKNLNQKETAVLAEKVLGLSEVVPGDPVKHPENTATANTPRKNP